MKDSMGYDCVIQVLKTANVLWKEARRFFKRFGITEAQFNILNLLGQTTKGMSQRELSDLLVVDRSNVTLLLDRIAKHGWIERRDVPQDRRAYQVCLTKSGEALWKRVLPHYYQAIQRAIDSVSSTKLHTAIQVLQTIESQSKQWRAL